jgi:hypothetical protein
MFKYQNEYLNLQIGCNFCPFRVPNGLRGQKSTSCFFLEPPKALLASMMNCMGSVKVLVATLPFSKNSD